MFSSILSPIRGDCDAVFIGRPIRDGLLGPNLCALFERLPVLIRSSDERLISPAQIGHHLCLPRDPAATAKRVRDVELLESQHARTSFRQLIQAGRTHRAEPQDNAIVGSFCGPRRGGLRCQRLRQSARECAERACGTDSKTLTTFLDRLFEIGDQIFRLLQADRYTRVARRNTAVLFLFSRGDSCDGIAQAGGIKD